MGVVLEDQLFQIQKGPLVRNLLSYLHTCAPSVVRVTLLAAKKRGVSILLGMGDL